MSRLRSSILATTIAAASCAAPAAPPLSLSLSSPPPPAPTLTALPAFIGSTPPSLVQGDEDVATTVPNDAPIMTALPIYSVVPADIGAKKVTLHYKAFGEAKWSTLTMAPIAGGWGVEIRCDHLTVAGPVKFFVVVLDKNDDIVATHGTMHAPLVTQIKEAPSGVPPAFPGRNPPKRCRATDEER